MRFPNENDLPRTPRIYFSERNPFTKADENNLELLLSLTHALFATIEIIRTPLSSFFHNEENDA